MKRKLKKDLIIGDKKKEIRKKYLFLRNRLDERVILSKSLSINKKIINLKIYKKSKTIMFFVKHKSEINTDIMIEQSIKDGKDIVVPCINKKTDNLCAIRITSLANDLKPGSYGIREPKLTGKNKIAPCKIDLVFVPGIVFDLKGYRIGYGKGYYDSWLKKFLIEKRIGLAFDFQVLRNLPKNDKDLPVGMILTEKRIIKINESCFKPAKGAN